MEFRSRRWFSILDLLLRFPGERTRGEGGESLAFDFRFMFVRGSVLCIVALLFAAPLPAARVAEQGMVMVFSTLDGETAEQIGSGFVVGFDRRSTYVLTAQHVIDNSVSLRLRFASDPHVMHHASLVRKNRVHDVAVLKVDGFVPGAVSLPFDRRAVAAADRLHAIGFLDRSLRPRWVTASISSDEGERLVLDRPLAEGHSGGPVLRNGWVVGMVKETDYSFAFAVPSVLVHRLVTAWQVPVTIETSAAPTALLPSPVRFDDEGDESKPEAAPPEEDGTWNAWSPSERPVGTRDRSPAGRGYPCQASVTSLSGGSQPVRVAASDSSMATASLPMGTRVVVSRHLANGGYVFFEVAYATQGGSARGWMRSDHLQRATSCP